jgi:hypothetical protein
MTADPRALLTKVKLSFEALTERRIRKLQAAEVSLAVVVRHGMKRQRSFTRKLQMLFVSKS